jgi:hypothetical protein
LVPRGERGKLGQRAAVQGRVRYTADGEAAARTQTKERNHKRVLQNRGGDEGLEEVDNNQRARDTRQKRIREEVQQTYSACLCQQFLYRGRGPIPEYIDSMDFSAVVQERKQEVKAWKAAKKVSGGC